MGKESHAAGSGADGRVRGREVGPFLTNPESQEGWGGGGPGGRGEWAADRDRFHVLAMGLSRGGGRIGMVGT